MMTRELTIPGRITLTTGKWIMFLGLMLLLPLVLTKHHAEICHFSDHHKKCSHVISKLYQDFLPDDSCYVSKECAQCTSQTWRSFIWSPDTETKLIEPRHFVVQLNSSIKGHSKTYSCQNAGFPCTCNKNDRCNGSSEYCQELTCKNSSPCFCDVLEGSAVVFHVDENIQIENPKIISLTYCNDYMPSRSRRHRHRFLLDDEEAVFDLNGQHLEFHDPVVSVVTPGLLIVRKDGLETLIYFNSTFRQAVVPETFLRFPGKLQFIFVAGNGGKTIREELQIDGRSICHRLPCVLCMAAFEHLKCLPKTISYIIYTTIILLTALMIIYLRSALSAIVSIITSVVIICYQSYRMIRGTARLTMIGGAIVGQRVRDTLQTSQQYLNNVAMPERVSTVLVILALLSIVQAGDHTCNNHIFIQSTTTACEDVNSEETCQMSSQATITLENMKFSQCLWFEDHNKNKLFSLSIKLQKVTCVWNTMRQYFTFPTDFRVISSRVCPQANECGWGEHCVSGKRFPEETTESKQYPGVNRCIAIDSSSSTCLIIDSQPCLFYRAFLVPDHMQTYEVRALTGYTCSYNLEITEGMNQTSESAVTSHGVITRNGINIKILGAYDQLMQNGLIIRAGKNQEAYLDYVSPTGVPQENTVGQIQANTSLTKSFIFAESAIRCRAYEETLHCDKSVSALDRMRESKVTALPRTIGFHYFYMDEHGQLMSDLLFSKPVNVHLEFTNYKVTLQRRTVCPRIPSEDFTTEGCYSCLPLARLTFTAYSTCAEGTVSVVFERIKVATSTLRLLTTPSRQVIEFRAETRCLVDKLCLYGRTIHTCLPLKFCLQEASIELHHPNITALRFYANGLSSAQWWSGWNFSPTSLVTQLSRIIITILLTVFIFIFSCSTIMSLCRRN